MAEYELPQEYEFVDQFYDPPKNASERVERAIKNTSGEAYKRTAEASKAQTKAIAPPQIDQVSDVPEGYEVIDDANAEEGIDGDPVDYDVMTSIENIPESTGELISDTWQAITNPIDTITNMSQAAAGAIQKYHPDSMSNEYVPVADAVGDYYTNRYGGMDQFKTTAMEDPVGMLGDVLGVTTMGAGSIPKVGGKISKVATMLDPLDAPVKAVSSMIDPAGMYKSAAKFPTRFDKDVLANTALKERIMPTEGGILKAEGKVKQIDAQITEMIDSSVSRGEKINVDDLSKSVTALKQEMGGFKLNAIKDVNKIEKVVDDFNAMVEAKGYTNMSASDVQKFKQDIYSGINWKSKQNKGSKATVKAKKAYAKDAKLELEKIIPEIKGFNLREGDLIELMDGLGQPASRISNRDMMGIGIPIKTGVGTMIGEGLGSLLGAPGAGTAAGTAIGAIWGVLDSPKTKARLAIELNAIKNTPLSNAKARVMALEAIRNAGAINDELAE